MNVRVLRYACALTLLALLVPLAAHAAAAPGTEFSIPNPLGNNSTLLDIITQVANALLALAIPVAVGMYIWAGVLFLTAGASPNNYKKAKDILWYTTIGLVVIFIGGGFIDLIRSILSLGA